jgi:hypothetical protein
VRGSAHSCGSSARAAVHQHGLSAKRDKRGPCRHEDGQGQQRRRPIIAPAGEPSFAAAPGLTRAGGLACMNEKHTIARRTTLETAQCNAAASTAVGQRRATQTPLWALLAVVREDSEHTVVALHTCRDADPYLRVRSKLVMKLQRAGTSKGSSFPLPNPFTNQDRPLFCVRRRALDCRGAGMAQWVQFSTHRRAYN